ncbi:MAG: hypothetical protein M5U34_20960 [Chloroflexi bacterium]|nr:hypothetical protein [Chloroflexota bacterium]
MSNFDWQQEGEQWDEPLIPAPPTPEKRKRPFVPLLVLGALLLLAGWVLFRQADEQIDAVTITMQTDVLAAHNLVKPPTRRLMWNCCIRCCPAGCPRGRWRKRRRWKRARCMGATPGA